MAARATSPAGWSDRGNPTSTPATRRTSPDGSASRTTREARRSWSPTASSGVTSQWCSGGGRAGTSDRGYPNPPAERQAPSTERQAPSTERQQPKRQQPKRQQPKRQQPKRQQPRGRNGQGSHARASLGPPDGAHHLPRPHPPR